MSNNNSATRRRVLRSLGVVGLAGVAGCSGDGDPTDTETPGDPTDTETPGDPTDTETPGDLTDTETPGNTAEPTDTPTDTAESIPDPPDGLLTFSEEAVHTSRNTTVTVTGSIDNTYLFPLQSVDISLDGPSGWDIQPASDVSFETIEASGSKDVSWEVTVPESAESETQLTATVSYATSTDEAMAEVTTTVTTPKETVRAAWLYNAPVGERGWVWAHDQARQAVETIDWVETDFTANVAPGDAEQALRDYADEGYDVIFGTTADYADALGSVASDNPDTAFEHCQGFSTDINKGRYFGRMDQLRYLTGVAAGMVTEANALGYVAPYPFSEIVRGINAFTLGARSVNGDATVSVEWSKAWFEPSAESDAADVLLQDGVDVMAQHQDSTAALEAAANDGVWAMGYQSPMGEVAGENYLTSPLWNWAAFYEPTLRDVRNFEWTADFYYGGLGDGVVTLDDWGPMVSGDVKNEVASTRDDIASGNLDIWADSAFPDWSEGERYEQMGAGGNGSYVDGVEGSLSEEDLPGE